MKHFIMIIVLAISPIIQSLSKVFNRPLAGELVPTISMPQNRVVYGEYIVQCLSVYLKPLLYLLLCLRNGKGSMFHRCHANRVPLWDGNGSRPSAG